MQRVGALSVAVFIYEILASVELFQEVILIGKGPERCGNDGIIIAHVRTMTRVAASIPRAVSHRQSVKQGHHPRDPVHGIAFL